MSKPANETIVTFEPFSDIIDKYRNADKGDKARIRRNTEKKAQDALLGGNVELATRLTITLKSLVPEKSDKPVDFAQIVSNLTNVVSLLNKAISDVQDEAAKSGNPVDSDNLPKPTNDDKADKMVKSLMSRKSDRRDISGVFERAFDGRESGHVMLVSEIANEGALPDYQPGSGAVAARLRGDEPGTLTDSCTLSGFEPVWVGKDGSVSSELARPSLAHHVGARKL